MNGLELTHDSPGSVSEVTYGMGIYLPLDALLIHDLQAFAQYLITSHTSSHNFEVNILHPVTFLETCLQTLWCIGFSFARAQYVCEVLSVCIHAHGRHSEVDVQKVALFDGGVRSGPAWKGLWRDDGDAGMVPS